MKTTIDIPDALLAEAQDLARREGTTLKALASEGLRQVLADKKARRSSSCETLQQAAKDCTLNSRAQTDGSASAR